MRSDIINAFEHPRRIIRQTLSAEDCVHANHFDSGDLECRGCEQKEECIWLMQNDSSDAMQQKSDEALVSALEFATGYIDNYTMLEGHDAQKCQCTSCQWLKQANSILEDFFIRS